MKYSSYIESVIDGSQIDHTIKSSSDHDSSEDSQSADNELNIENNNQSSIEEPTPKFNTQPRRRTEFTTTKIKVEDFDQNQEIKKHFDQMQGQVDRLEAKMDNLINVVGKLANTQQSTLSP